MTTDPVSVAQDALRREAGFFGDPEGFYRPSPGQLWDHVNHRVADVVITALKEAGILENR